MHTLEDSILIHTHKYTMYTGTQDHNTCIHTHTHTHTISHKRVLNTVHTHTYIHTYLFYQHTVHTPAACLQRIFQIIFRAMDHLAICELAIATCIYGSSMYVLRQ